MSDQTPEPPGGPHRSIEELRLEAQRRRDERVAATRRLLELVPGDLRDLDAAATCGCVCHPSPGGDPHGGRACPCQLTPEERRASIDAAMKSLAASRDQYSAGRRARESELAAIAAELDAVAVEESPGAPWAITGAVDGRAFYMRERWDQYEVVIAPDSDPALQPWSAPIETPTIVVRSGVITDLQSRAAIDYRTAMTVIVGEVRAYLRRMTCSHPSQPGDAYCRMRGRALVDPAALRATGPR
ncbi:hypothetical protein [Cellulomonas cellasea]|uniref:Uncharacterized protein n=1 Tax=Cellulomonas cellasea TaxID=43670 RepID=A0A7W4UHT0_9CELL|nr:hypothetical protein [Cellulomonas cellasea]MBB2924094.1 hypothetical protein [Cellulomonas cellasea]